MKYVSEFRQPDLVHSLVQRLHKKVTRPWNVMEICGGQTHSIYRYGLPQLLPPSLTLLHGPGCPVCVTPAEKIDLAVHLAQRPQTIVCSFGDLLRVPGSHQSLLDVKARGGNVNLVKTPLEAVSLAKRVPDHEVVFFAVGFETTTPANAMAVYEAKRAGVRNFSMIVSQVMVPPAIRYLLADPENAIDGFLAAGHVCTITGYEDYFSICDDYQTPIVVTGFEPVDILLGLGACIDDLEQGKATVSNRYDRVVQRSGNPTARRIVDQVFSECDQHWRGIGVIPNSGLRLSPAYRQYDAEERFQRAAAISTEAVCQAGAIMQGKLQPEECPHFAKTCRPEKPMGAPMVSSEGVCAAAFQYQTLAAPNAQSRTENLHDHT